MAQSLWSCGLLGLVDLVEKAAIVEVLGLGLLPPPEGLINGQETDVPEAGDVFGISVLRLDGAVEVLRGQSLTGGRVEEFEVRLGHFPCATTIDDLVDYRNRGLGEDADGWVNDFEV